VVESISIPFSEPITRKHRHLSPSVFWIIRQGFPKRLSVLLVVMSLIVPLTVWTIVSSLQIIPPIFLPTPMAVMAAGFKMFTENNLGEDLLSSCSRVLAGFVLAAVIGVPGVWRWALFIAWIVYFRRSWERYVTCPLLDLYH
jgi:NitT/TauT family transport system permease protein